MDAHLAARVLSRHGLFAVLFVAGVVLRATSSYGWGTMQLVSVVSAAVIYPTARFWGCWTWLAALAAAPALFDRRMLDDQPGRLVVATALLCVWVVLLGLAPSAPLQRASRPVRVAVIAVGLASGLAALLVYRGRVVSTDPGVPAAHLPSLVLLAMTLVGVGAAPGVARATSWSLWRVTLAVAFASILVTGLTDVVWAPLAGTLGLTALVRGRRTETAPALRQTRRHGP